MDKKQSFDTGFIVPILIGFFSLFGICLVVLIGRLHASRVTDTVPETSTPFQYLFLGTEPGISTSALDEEIDPTGTNTPLFLPPPFIDIETTPVDIESTTGVPLITKAAITPGTPTLTSGSTAPLNPGTYDQADVHILYTGDWIFQSGLPNAYQNSLHVSNSLGNTAALRFIGQQIRIFYQSGPGLGTIRIVIDGLQFDLDQSKTDEVTSEWVSALLINGTHSVVITHLSGGSINLDSFIVPDVLITPTTTAAP